MRRSHSLVRLALVVVWLVLLAAPRVALALSDVTYCIDVNVSYAAAGGGDFWTDNGTDKPAAGFHYDLSVQFGTPSTRYGNFDADGCAVEAQIGGWANLTINPTFFYSGSGNQGVHQDASDVAFATDYIYYSQTLEKVINYSDEAYAQMALVSNAVNRHDAGLTNEIFVIDHDGCCDYDGDIHLSATEDNKYRIASLLGENIADLKLGAAALTSTLANTDNCDGGPNWLQKKYQSASIVEGIAGFYSLSTWNRNSDTDCDARSLFPVDTDLNGVNNYVVADNIPCAYNQDIDGASPGLTDGEDWLYDLIVGADSAGCDDEYVDRSTEYDWWRYLWNMYAFGDDTTAGNAGSLTVQDIFDLYVAVDPSTWDSDGGGATTDDPWPLWDAQADTEFHDAHDLWYPGVDH